MKIVDMKALAQLEVTATADTTASQSHWSSSPGPAEVLGHKSYHELADFPIVEVDAMAQLHSNLALLDDLQGRLAFVMREVRYLMKV